MTVGAGALYISVELCLLKVPAPRPSVGTNRREDWIVNQVEKESMRRDTTDRLSVEIELARQLAACPHSLSMQPPLLQP